MIVESSERSTGRGATSFTAVLVDGEWKKISQLSNSRYLGRDRGWENYEVEVPDDTIAAEFYRSNKGNEQVRATNGLEWASFDEAHRWAKRDR